MNIKRILPALLSVILLVSYGCADYDAEFKRVDDRIDEIESKRTRLRRRRLFDLRRKRRNGRYIQI